MSSISSLDSLSALLNSYTTQKASSSTASASSTAGTSGTSSAGGNESTQDDETVTTTEKLADGSMLIIVTQGDKVISETKVSIQNSTANSKNNSSAPTNQLDRFNDSSASSSALTGSLFSSSI
ncbi:hypothetical protein [Pectinatus haikarae]|uniref:Uncharacterized protein n=1 Tax=Pectinatus haikarae TaxID=349096 RepID=A0ABT9Y766_9FIRM|nr:hypothetical protein [Pectinatus haikarae]MDQ0203386.1 hypothetical protein [Pectinatus haikarae]